MANRVRHWIRAGTSTISLLFLGATLAAATKSPSCSNEVTQNIKEYIREFCPDPGSSSSSSGVDIQGSGELSSNKLLQNLVTTKFSAGANWKSEKSNGILQSQLAAAKRDKIECNVKTLEILMREYFPREVSNCLKLASTQSHPSSIKSTPGQPQKEDIIYKADGESVYNILRAFVKERPAYNTGDIALAANITCRVSRSLHVERCRVISEEPLGFGEVVIRIYEKMILRYSDSEGRPWAGRNVYFPVSFRATGLAADELRSAGEDHYPEPPPLPPPLISPPPSGHR